MIDGFKVRVKRNLDRLRNHPSLSFFVSKITDTGELEDMQFPEAEYKGLKFTDKGKCIEITGSLHKFANDGKHNHNDFSLKQIQDVIYKMCTEFHITACTTPVFNLEVGINVKLDYDPNVILSSLIMYRGELFTFQKSLNKQYRECEHTQYYIKIYNKGLQYGLKHYIIRFEVKYRKMEPLKKLKIKLLSDLMNPLKLQKLTNLLLSVYDDIVIGDCTINPKEMDENSRILFANGHNPNWWNTIKPVSKNFQGGTDNKEFRAKDKQYYRELNRFNELLKENGATKRKEELGKLLEDKAKQCLNLTSLYKQKCLNLTSPVIKKVSEFDRLLNKKSKVLETINLSEFDTLLYSDKKRQSIKKCMVTGLDISMQKESSRFLCTSGIKYYKKNHPHIWAYLSQRIESKWQQFDEAIQINEIHHSIRNQYFNKINNTKRSISQLLKKPSLFSQFELVRKDKLDLAGYIHDC